MTVDYKKRYEALLLKHQRYIQYYRQAQNYVRAAKAVYPAVCAIRRLMSYQYLGFKDEGSEQPIQDSLIRFITHMQNLKKRFGDLDEG